MQNKKPEEISFQFGARVKGLRESSDYTQVTLAAAMGTTQSIVSKIEKGIYPISQELLAGAAKAFNCEPWELLLPSMDETDSFREIVSEIMSGRTPLPIIRELLGLPKKIQSAKKTRTRT